MRVLLTGASGQLGPYLLDRLRERGHDVIAWRGLSRADAATRSIDVADLESLDRAVAADDPEIILHAAALSTIEGVRRDPARAEAVNVRATARLADWCKRLGRRLVLTSTDLVFDGSKPWNREDDPTGPSTTYGRTKVEAERAVLASSRGLVARLSLLYGPSRSGRPTPVDLMIAGLRRGEPQTFFEDEFRTPLDLGTAADLLVRLAESDRSGVLHVGGSERLSRLDLGRRIASSLGFDPLLVRGNRQADVAFAEPRPADVSLDTSALRDALPAFIRAPVEEVVRDWA